MNAETAHACMSTNYSADPVVAIPVLDMTTNVTYANIYCAMCHGKSRDLHLWSIRIERRPGQVQTLNAIGSTDVLWGVIPVGELIPEKCVVTPSEASTEPDTKIKQLCRSYANVIGARDVEDVKNPHCALLSNPNVLINRTFRCYRSIRLPPRAPSMLFVFSIHAKTDLRFSQIVHVQVNCTFNEVYDPFQGRCLPVHSSRSNSNKTNMTDQCQGPRFPSHELVVLSNNSVFIIPHSKLYNNDSYILVNQTLILCINFTRNYTSRNYTKKVTPTYNNEKPPSHAHALRILTYVGSSLSIIALLFLLVTYFLFAELRTYPGKMVMHLSCAMIAMQSVYFASDPDVVSSAVCAVMGALLHYFILAVFLWMSVITHNTQKTISTLSK